MIHASHISLTLNGKPVLHHVEAMVQPHLFTAVVGPNGAGKSTLLKVLAGELRPHTGSVSVNGKKIASYSAKALSMVRAVLPQSSNLQFPFTVGQLILFGRHAHDTSSCFNNNVVDEVIELIQLSHLRNRNYMTLSAGEKQRVQFARVLAQLWEEKVYPRYILLDEPTSSLDIAQQQNIFSIAKAVCSRGIGVMAIVHDLNLAVQFADQLYFMKNGAVTAYGEARKVFTKAIIEDTFCCEVNLHDDLCNNCPYVTPQPGPSNEFSRKLKINEL